MTRRPEPTKRGARRCNLLSSVKLLQNCRFDICSCPQRATGTAAISVIFCVTTYRAPVHLYTSPKKQQDEDKKPEKYYRSQRRGIVGLIRPRGYGNGVRLLRGVLGTLLERAIRATDEWKPWWSTSFKTEVPSPAWAWVAG